MALPTELRSLLLPIHANLDCGKCLCGAFVDVDNAWVPRIMVGARKGVRAVKLIVVGKNPGHPVPEEASHYRQAISQAHSPQEKMEMLFDEMVRWGEKCHLESVSGRQGIYHRRLMAFVKEVLDAKNNDEVLDEVYFTELMKCSTPENEQAKLESLMATTCIKNWLVRELEILPKVPILALGREAELFLRRISPEIDARTVYLSHPSWPLQNYEVAKNELRMRLQAPTRIQ